MAILASQDLAGRAVAWCVALAVGGWLLVFSTLLSFADPDMYHELALAREIHRG